MTIKTLSFCNPAALFNPIPYGFCHTVKTPPNGELIFISGQSGGEGKTHSLSHDFDRQVDRVLANLEIALTTHQLSFDDVVKITILIVDHNAEKLEIWSNAMKKRWSKSLRDYTTERKIIRRDISSMICPLIYWEAFTNNI